LKPLNFKSAPGTPVKGKNDIEIIIFVSYLRH